ncbi:GntR family transcriptional regulator [Nonomuraea sp. B12E4]|uniref:GntR family transcriptional regulator n=1 Tax=Nonomuraea sp. B12E4 TaxID=3153564 RepID=UPI00325ED92A
MPSEKALCAQFGVARDTMRRALAVLENEGLIRTIPSKGRLVLGGQEPEREQYPYQEVARDLREQIGRGDLEPGCALPSESRLQGRALFGFRDGPDVTALFDEGEELD